VCDRTINHTRITSILALFSLTLVGVTAPTAGAQEVLPRPAQPFGGRIGLTAQDSIKDFPKEVQAPKGAPNILLILTDDVGFGASSTFGGPVPTPTMERLAKNGLRYTHTQKNKSFQIAASVEIPAGGAEGMLITQGGRFAGWGLYVLGGKPVFCYNLAGVDRYYVNGQDTLAPGKHAIALDFKYDGPGLGKGGTATLTVDGKPAGGGKLARTMAFRISLDETLDCGEDTGTPVSESYQVPFKFTGTIAKVAIKIGEAKLTPQEQEEYDEIWGRGALAE
jgi:hypothetical protein